MGWFCTMKTSTCRYVVKQSKLNRHLFLTAQPVLIHIQVYHLTKLNVCNSAMNTTIPSICHFAKIACIIAGQSSDFDLNFALARVFFSNASIPYLPLFARQVAKYLHQYTNQSWSCPTTCLDKIAIQFYP